LVVLYEAYHDARSLEHKVRHYAVFAVCVLHAHSTTSGPCSAQYYLACT